MSKRFTDTEKWDDPWFCDLSPQDKLFWNFLCDKCDHAGIWKVNMKLAEFHLERKPDLSVLGDRVAWLNDEKIFLPGFLSFQYGMLNENSKVHKSVLDKLKKEGVSIPYGNPMEWVKDKDKDKDKVKKKVKKKKEEYSTSVEQIWNCTPKMGRERSSKKDLQTAWNTITPKPDIANVLECLESYCQSEDWTKKNGQFVPAIHRWIKSCKWETKSPESQKPKAPQKPRYGVWEDA